MLRAISLNMGELQAELVFWRPAAATAHSLTNGGRHPWCPIQQPILHKFRTAHALCFLVGSHDNVTMLCFGGDKEFDEAGRGAHVLVRTDDPPDERLTDMELAEVECTQLMLILPVT